MPVAFEAIAGKTLLTRVYGTLLIERLLESGKEERKSSKMLTSAYSMLGVVSTFLRGAAGFVMMPR